MEHWGQNQNYVQSAVHSPSSFGSTVNLGGQTIPTASSEFHTYSLEWFPEKLVFRVDGNHHYTYEPPVRDADTWPFDAEQYILLNFAFLPHIDPGFTEDAMEVEYVRVYQTTPATSVPKPEEWSFNLTHAPNPAHDLTLIRYDLPGQMDAAVSVYDMQGRIIQTLISGQQAAGRQQVDWNVRNLAPGLYFISLRTEDQVITRKCVIR
jgi:hypothetical protein